MPGSHAARCGLRQGISVRGGEMLDVRLGCRLGLNTEQDGAGPGFGVCCFSPPLSCFQQRKGSLPACLPACWGSSRRTERGTRGCFEPDVGEAEQPPVAGGYSAPASLPGGIQIQSSPRCERFVAASIVTWSDCLKLHTPSPGFGKAPRDAVAPPHPTCPLSGQVNSARPHAYCRARTLLCSPVGLAGK